MIAVTSPSLQDSIRLDAICKNLRVGSKWRGPEMTSDVVTAAVEAVAPALANVQPTGQGIADRLSTSHSVRFREVYRPDDISLIEDEYLRGKKEIGFALMRRHLKNPTVDALLFQRQFAKDGDPDRWVAVLNLQFTSDRAYWNKYHEISHRVAEPPQKILPFLRESSGSHKSAVETLMDQIAAELAFLRRYFGPILDPFQGQPLTFPIIEIARGAYAPTASLLATTNAVVNLWRRPTIAFTASLGGRRSDPTTDIALRAQPQCRNHAARDCRLFIFPNMRVPASSPIYHAFEAHQQVEAVDRLCNWTTSNGSHLDDLKVSVSAKPLGERLYCLMTL